MVPSCAQCSELTRSLSQDDEQGTNDLIESETESIEDEITGEQREQERIEPHYTCQEDTCEPGSAERGTEVPVRIELGESELEIYYSNKDGHESIELIMNEHGNNKPGTSDNYLRELLKIESDEFEPAEGDEGKMKPETDEEEGSKSETSGPEGIGRRTSQAVESDEESIRFECQEESTESDGIEESYVPETTKLAGNNQEIDRGRVTESYKIEEASVPETTKLAGNTQEIYRAGVSESDKSAEASAPEITKLAGNTQELDGGAAIDSDEIEEASVPETTMLTGNTQEIDRGWVTESDKIEEASAPEITKLVGNTQEIEVIEAQEYGRESNKPKTSRSGDKGDSREKTEQKCETDTSGPETTRRRTRQASEKGESSESDDNEQRSPKQKITDDIKNSKDCEDGIVEPEQSREKSNESQIIVCNFIWTVRILESETDISEAEDSEEVESEPGISETTTIGPGIVGCNFPLEDTKSEMSGSVQQGDSESTRKIEEESIESESTDPATNETDELGEELSKPEFEGSQFNVSEGNIDEQGQTKNMTVDPAAGESGMSDPKQIVEPGESAAKNPQPEVVPQEANKLEISRRGSSEVTQADEKSIESEESQQATIESGPDSGSVQVSVSGKFESEETAFGQGQNEEKAIGSVIITEETSKPELIVPDETDTESWKSKRETEHDSKDRHADETASEDINLETTNLEGARIEPSTNILVTIGAEVNNQAGESEASEKSEFESEMFEQGIFFSSESEEDSSHSSEWEVVERRTNRRKTQLPVTKLDPLQQLQLLANAHNKFDLEDSNKENEPGQSIEVQTSEPSTSKRRSSDLEEIKTAKDEEEVAEVEASKPKKHRKRKNRKIPKTIVNLPGREELKSEDSEEGSSSKKHPFRNSLNLIKPELNDSSQHHPSRSGSGKRIRRTRKTNPDDFIRQTLSDIESNVTKIDFMYCYNKNMGNLPDFIPDEKDYDECMQEIDNAATLVLHGDNAGALQTYNGAIALAKDSGQVGLCHNGRSRVLYNLGLYKECFEECNKALSFPFLSGGLVGSQLEGIRHKASSLIPSALESRTYHEEVPKIKPKHRNPNMQSVSDFIQVKNNAESGRHYIAKKDINIGQLLMVESPYVSTLNYNDRSLHCHHCLELSYTPIPCDTCTWVLYCGDDCKMEAFESYHKYECRIQKNIDRIHSPWTIPHSHCLRLIFKARREIFFDEVPHPDDRRYRSDRFKEIYQLQGLLEKNGNNKQFEMCSVVSIMFHFVKNHTDFFEEHDEDKFKEVLLNVCSIIMNNSTSICQLSLKKQKTMYNPYSFAEGLYPALSLFNHSCAPNVYSVFYGGTAVVYSIQTIKKGQQCFISYGDFYYQNKKENRRSSLRRHCHFQCNCIACENDWPTMVELSERPEKMFLLKNWSSGMQIPLVTLNVQSARNELGPCIPQLKKAEKNIPSQAHVLMTELVIGCLEVMGNKNFALGNMPNTLDM